MELWISLFKGIMSQPSSTFVARKIKQKLRRNFSEIFFGTPFIYEHINMPKRANNFLRTRFSFCSVALLNHLNKLSFIASLWISQMEGCACANVNIALQKIQNKTMQGENLAVVSLTWLYSTFFFEYFLVKKNIIKETVKWTLISIYMLASSSSVFLSPDC